MEYKSPKVGLGIIILNELKEVLLILRNSNSKKADSEMRLEGTWTLPAGKVKYGETLFEAAKRTVGIISNEVSGDINLGNTEEHIDYNYFNINELPKNLCEPSKKIINNYLMKKLYK